jgi:hypothetical protein
MCLPAANGAPKITFLTMKMLLATSLSFLVLIAMPVALSAARYWQTPFRLVGSRPLQCRPASPCPRAFGFVGPRLFGAHGALEGHLCHSHLDRAEARRRALRALRSHRLGRFDPRQWLHSGRALVWTGAGRHIRGHGATADTLIPRMRAAIADYRYRNHGDYNAWPGPNSNTFVSTILAAVPEIGVTLPATAIGKDFSLD